MKIPEKCQNNQKIPVSLFWQSTTGSIYAYGADKTTVLASYSVDGDSNGLNDNSAVFLGVADTVADIGAIQFTASSTDPQYPGWPIFGINKLSLISPSNPNAITPEPSTFLLLGAGLGGLALLRRKARK